MSYTDKEVTQMTEIYSANPCLETVDRLTVLLNRTRKSIISKLVKEGVYIPRGYRTKSGEFPITKLELVRSIEDALDTTLPGLDKAPKTTLKNLATCIVEQTELFEDAIDNLQELSESHTVVTDMLKTKRSSAEEAFDILK